ncbi:iron-containing redox enzyme family protein [Pseudomonadota bacterium]
MDIDTPFKVSLMEAAGRWPLETSRLVRLVNDSKCPRFFFRKYSREVYVRAQFFLEDVAQLACICPEDGARQFMLDNFLFEIGAVATPEKGVSILPGAMHISWAKRFAYACGNSDKELEAALLESVGKRAFQRALIQQRRWLEAIAYLVVGQEAQLPRLLIPLVGGLKKHGFGSSDLVFFTQHIKADSEHVSGVFEVMETVASTQPRRDLALEYVALGARDYWLAVN